MADSTAPMLGRQLTDQFNSPANEASLVLAPDGQELFLVRWDGVWGEPAGGPSTILHSTRRVDGGWSEPRPAWFSGRHDDQDPFIDGAGRWLYFSSDRPAPDNGAGQADLWRVALDGAAEPQWLPQSGPGYDASPVATAEALYFASVRPGGYGQGDIYRAPRQNDGFGEAVLLGEAVNAPSGEWNLHVAADESWLIVEASGRSGNMSPSGDLYFALASAAGWTATLPLPQLNSTGSDLLPRVTPDGTLLIYTRASWDDRQADLVGRPMAPLLAGMQSRWAWHLWVANRASHSLSRIDLSTGRADLTVATGHGPHLPALQGGQIAVAAYGQFPRFHADPVDVQPPWESTEDGRVGLYDRHSGALMWQVDSGCTRPHGALLLDDRVLLSCEDREGILSLARRDGGDPRFYASGAPGAHVLEQLGGKLVAVSNVDAGSVSLIDLGTGEVREVASGAGAEALRRGADGQLWVANAQAGTLSEIDPISARLVRSSSQLCGFPIDMEVVPDLLWIACNRSAELIGWDPLSGQIRHRIELPSAPLNLVLHPQAAIAWVSLPRQNRVVEVDLLRGVLSRSFEVGSEPDGLVLAPH